MATHSKKRRLPDADEEAIKVSSNSSNPVKKRKTEATQETAKEKPIANACAESKHKNNAEAKEATKAPKKAGLDVPDEPLVIIFLTGNKGKLREVQAYLGDDLGKYLTNYKVDLDEIQGSEEEILAHKLYGAQQHLKKMENSSADLKAKEVFIMVEDTSLFLGQYSKKFNFPGPFCKWALKANGNQSYIDMVESHEDRSCTAMCMFALLRVGPLNSGGGEGEQDEDEEDDDLRNEYKPRFFKGECKGTVTEKPRGDNGFGWDPIFEFVGNKKTFAEMNTDEKNKISHRANALKSLKEYLENDLLAKGKGEK